jgi:chemotaxis protein MotD
MNKADLLTATFRQLAATKTASRGSASHATTANDGKEKAAHFRDQFRLVAQAAKSAPKAEIEAAKTEAKPAIEANSRAVEVAEVVEQLIAQPKDPADRPSKKSPEPSTPATPPSPAEWRGPEAALSAVISRLEQAQSAPAPHADIDADADAAVSAIQPGPRAEARAADLKPIDLAESPKPGSTSEPRFTLTAESAETRTPSPIKVAVRDQETHFEPVQQPSLLQKIVDRMASDLPVAATPAAPASAEVVLPDFHKPTDSPVKMLTLHLDPPDLGAVTVKMRLTGDAVEIRLSADRAETAQLLKSERSALTDIMQSAGYKFDIAAIDQSRASDANTGAGQQQPQPDQRPSQQPLGGSSINDANSERQSGDTQSGTRQNRQQHEQFTERAERPQDKEPVRDRNSGAVYL